MKKSNISLNIDFGSGEVKQWCKITIPIEDNIHIRIWNDVEKFIKQKIKEMKK